MQEINDQQHKTDKNNNDHSDISLATPLQVGCRWQPEHPHFHNQKRKIKGWKLHLLNADEFHSGNVAVLKRKGFNLVIDSGCDLVDNLKKLTQKVDAGEDIKTFLINTHGHPDHTGGNSNLASDGAIVISHQQAKEAMINYGLVASEGLPSITFRKQLSLNLGNQLIELIHLPSGHTDGDIAVWLPKLNVLHTGDPYMSHDYPLIDQGNKGSISDLIKTISKLLKVTNQETLIIPGHGDLSSRSDLIEYRYMLKSISSDVERMKAMGLSLRQVQQQKPTQKFDSRWEGDLITGDQFVGFIYNTLEDKTTDLLASSSNISEKSPSLKHTSNNTNEAPWELSFNVSEIKTSSDRKGRLTLNFKGEDATKIHAFNNKNQKHSKPLAIKKLARNFDELTGKNFADASLTYSQEKRMRTVDFRIYDIKRKRQGFSIQSDMMDRINELSMSQNPKYCQSTNLECHEHFVENASFTVNMPLIPGYE